MDGATLALGADAEARVWSALAFASRCMGFSVLTDVINRCMQSKDATHKRRAWVSLGVVKNLHRLKKVLVRFEPHLGSGKRLALNLGKSGFGLWLVSNLLTW